MKKLLPPSGRLLIPLLACGLPLTGALANPVLASSLLPERAVRQPNAAITGRVVDVKGAGIPGVTVLVKGTQNGTTTDANGNFSLDAPDNGTLVISSIGYTSQEILINGRTTFNVTLSENNQQLNEVVVMGYVSQDRQNLTSATVPVNVEAAKKAPVATITEAIQGRTPGVQINNSGTPGQAPNVVIRGAGTLYSGSNPLYVVDGAWTDNIRDLNPQDIATLNILKDASSTAIYGSRGANGVIIITTRRGRTGKPTFTVDASAGPQNVVSRWNLTNAAQWAAISRMAYQNAGRTPLASAANPQNYADTDWQSAILRTGSVQNYNVGLSGGGSGEGYSSNYLISGGYFKQKGTLIGTDFERYTLRLNSGITRGRFTINESAQLSHTLATLPNGQPFQDAVRLLPTIPVYDPTTSSGYGFGSDAAYTFGTNPVAEQEYINSTQYNNRLQGSLTPEFRFTDYLSYKLNLGIDALDYVDRSFRKPGIISYNAPNEPGYLTENRGDNLFAIAENTLNFNKSFGENHFNAVAGYSEQYRRYTNTFARANGYSQYGGQYFPTLSSGSTPVATTGGKSVYTKRSYFGQVVYDYKNRYLLTGSFRRDGSSQLDEKYANFYAGSVGWRLSEEEFFKSAAPFVSNLKPRFSYGVNGNDNLGDAYPSQALININAATIFNGNVLTPGAIQTGFASTNLRWERRYFTDYGFDLGFFDNRLTLSADYYISRTKDALVPISLPIYSGSFNTTVFGNLGEIENRGFEFVAGWQDNRGAFTYGITGNLSTLRNRVLATDAINSVYDQGVTQTQVGYPIGGAYMIQFNGVFQTQAEVDNYKTADGKVIEPWARPGDARYIDANGDGNITSADRVHIGTPFPTLTYGVSLNAGYKGFDLTVLLQGAHGNTVYNVARATMDRTDDPSNYRADFQPWTADNHSNTTPRALANNGTTADLQTASAQNSQPSSRFLEDGSYLRGKNVQLGYTFPKTMFEKLKGISNVRLFVTGQNFFTATKYTGPDPEFVNGNAFQRGVDFNSYPNLRTFTGGLQVGF
ncbi:TonB-dependent receptor [Hymenobacter sp. RP-2-7]|uniref:TonB-dependent receptor n=1 Tax=Hymenobacter polaris TaxID=2682546 RepID=A0A7Y0FMD3_9BACT|nr:TonB-dependent receptor [Hymenobacter polaris]NML65415.1 TonB-dependent receptor [Hymenobacter polaris]